VDNNGLGSQVTFAGVMSSQQVNDTLRQHHVLLAPSVIASDFDREGLPTVLKEALACEVPVISTWHGGIPELITNCKHGFLVSERSVDQLAERMMRFIKEPKIIENFGKAGRQRVLKLFDINKEIQTLENLYDKVISSHR
jgi:glycosyltransferase involved in cell wall biosynthesis